MTEFNITLLIILVGGSLLTFARRFKNSDCDAGAFIALGTIFACCLYIFIQLGTK